MFLRELRPAVLILLVLSLVTGVAYPLLVTAIAQVVFPHAANGSLVHRDGRPVGSRLIGQQFSDARHFWSRPSATTPAPDNAASSGGSTVGPTNLALIDAVKARMEALRAADPGNTQPVPVDLVTASASGLDPHISPAAAEYQVGRVARARGMREADLRALIERHIDGRTFGVLGEPGVNVLELNLALDRAGR